MIKKIGLVFIGLLIMVTVGEAQLRYVVPGGSGTRDGSSWENAMAGIKEAINGGGKKVLVRWGTYALTEELVVPSGVEVSGGYGSDGERQSGGTEMTVLQATAKFRVARVEGILDGFTICGGIAAGENGGGVYVVSGGTVRNCIVRNNYAGRYYPRVGDVQLRDGSFLRMEELTAADEPRVRGIVFWINPDPDAVEGNRGWLVSKYPIVNMGKWAGTNGADIQVTDATFETWKEAVEDTMGWSHCQKVKASGRLGYVPAIQACLEYDGGGWAEEKGKWYLPALGQLRCLVAEYALLERTWKKIFPAYPSFINILCCSSSEVMSTGTTDTRYVWAVEYANPLKWGTLSKINKGSSVSGYIPVTSF